MATLYFPKNNYMFKVNNRNTRTWCEIKDNDNEIWLKSTIKTSCSSASVVEQVIIGEVIFFRKTMLYVLWTTDKRSYLISLKI